MKKRAAIVVLALMVSTSAIAGERTTDTALGAIAGAVVLGPIGAAAGAFIGYTAGPSMSRAWGVRGRSSSARQTRRTASNEQPAYRESQPAMREPSAAPAAAAAPKAPKAPPVQPLE
jgi:hypothetical protein